MKRLGKLCGPCCGRAPKAAASHAEIEVVLPKGAKRAQQAAKVERPDFSGTWRLSGSRNFDEYLAAIGVNYVKRKLAASMTPVQEWALVDGGWQFAVATPIGLRLEKFPIGARGRRGQCAPAGIAALTRCRPTLRAPLSAGDELEDDVDGERMVKVTTWDGAVMHTAVVPRDAAKRAKFGVMSMCAAARARARARAARG